MDLSYLNARVYGWKAKLLKEGDLKRLLAAYDVDAFVDLLRPTSFGPDINIAEARYAGSKSAEPKSAEPKSERTEDVISAALRTNLERSFAALWKNAPEECYVFLRAALSSWEVSNLKAVIRGVERGIPREDILKSIAGVGDFDYGAMNELLGAKDLAEVVRILKSWGSLYATPLKRSLKDYLRTKSLAQVEFSLDVFAFNHYLKLFTSKSLDSTIAREVLADRVDGANITTLFKLAGEGFSREAACSLFIPGGTRIDIKTFAKLTELKEREELISALAEAVSDSHWKGALLSTDLRGGRALTLEEGFEFLTGERLIRRAIVEPLSIASPCAYIYRKLREVKNLRLILRGKLFKIPSVELQDLIMIYGLPSATIAVAA